jgi:hypothetical protein
MHVAHTGEMRNAQHFGQKTEMKTPLTRSRCKLEDRSSRNSVILWTGFIWLRIGSCEHENELSGTIKLEKLVTG